MTNPDNLPLESLSPDETLPTSPWQKLLDRAIAISTNPDSDRMLAHEVNRILQVLNFSAAIAAHDPDKANSIKLRSMKELGELLNSPQNTTAKPDAETWRNGMVYL